MTTSSVPHTCGIYIITCLPTGKVYIGSSRNLSRRWIEHRRDLRGGYHCNPYLQRAWNKYGENAFFFDLLEACSRNEVIQREQYWLDTLKPFAPNGFNIGIRANSGMAGRKASPETRAKLSVAHKGYVPTIEHRDKISAAKKGTAFTPQHRANIGKASKDRKQTAEGIARRLEIISKKYIVTSPDGQEIEVKGLSQFCRAHGLNASTMINVASGKRWQHKGWKCRRIDV